MPRRRILDQSDVLKLDLSFAIWSNDSKSACARSDSLAALMANCCAPLESSSLTCKGSSSEMISSHEVQSSS